MNADLELEELRREWQADSPPGRELRELVEKQSRWMRLALLGDIAVTVGIGGGVTARAALAGEPELRTLALATWVFIAAAWAIGIAANRGKWAPAALDTASYLDLAIRRCRSRLWAVYFGAALLVCEISFLAVWIYRYETGGKVPVLEWLLGAGFLWAVTFAFVVGLIWYWRKKRAELAYLKGTFKKVHS